MSTQTFIQAAGQAEQAFLTIAQIRQRDYLERQAQRNAAFQSLANSITGAFQNVSAARIDAARIQHADALQREGWSREDANAEANRKLQREMPGMYARERAAVEAGYPDWATADADMKRKGITSLADAQDARAKARLAIETDAQKSIIAEQEKARHARFLDEFEAKTKLELEDFTQKTAGMSYEEATQRGAAFGLSGVQYTRLAAGLDPNFVLGMTPEDKQALVAAGSARTKIIDDKTLLPESKKQALDDIKARVSTIMGRQTIQPRPDAVTAAKSRMWREQTKDGEVIMTLSDKGVPMAVRGSTSGASKGAVKPPELSNLYPSVADAFGGDADKAEKALTERIKNAVANMPQGSDDATRQAVIDKARDDFYQDAIPGMVRTKVFAAKALLPSPAQYRELVKTWQQTDGGAFAVDDPNKADELIELSQNFNDAIMALHSSLVTENAGPELRAMINNWLSKYGNPKLLLQEPPAPAAPPAEAPVKPNPVSGFGEWYIQGLVGSQ